MQLRFTLLLCLFFHFSFGQVDNNTPNGKQGSTEKFKATDMYYTPKSAEAQSLYSEGVALFDAAKYSQSISAYLKALAIEPGFIDAMDNLGNSYRYAGNFDSAEYWYLKSIEAYPKGFIAHQNLAIVYLSTSRLSDALNEYNTLTKLDPKNPEGYFGKANVYAQLNKAEDLIKNAQQARELYKANKDEYERDAVYMIGLGYYLQQNKAMAKKYLTEAKEMGYEIPSVLEEALK